MLTGGIRGTLVQEVILKLRSLFQFWDDYNSYMGARIVREITKPTEIPTAQIKMKSL